MDVLNRSTRCMHQILTKRTISLRRTITHKSDQLLPYFVPFSSNQNHHPTSLSGAAKNLSKRLIY